MIYLDNHSTTQIDPAVVTAMMPWLTQQYGNPHSSHAGGIAAADQIDHGLESIGRAIGAKVESVIVTSGATESNNLAIRGVCLHPRQKRRHIVTVASEHPAVLDVVNDLSRDGFRVTVVPVLQRESSRSGVVDIDRLAEAINEDTALVSVMYANNEMGVLAPIREIASLAHHHGALLHCDATQAVGRMAIDIGSDDIDLVSASAHKFYGPKGVGFLVVGGGERRVRLRPQVVGGGQQRGIRSGTMAPAMVVGMARALEICTESLGDDRVRIGAMRDRLWQRLVEGVQGIELNGPTLSGGPSSPFRLLGNLNLRLPLIEGESWMAAAPGVAFSTGSACSNVDPSPSHVLLAMGLTESESRRSARFGVGRFNTMAEIDHAADTLLAAVEGLKKYRLGG